MKTTRKNQNQTITLAQLCEALENGQVQAQLEDDTYVIRSGDLRRFVRSSMPELALTSRLARSYTQKAS